MPEFNESAYAQYGISETNNIANHQRPAVFDNSRYIPLADPQLAKITRLRLITDRDFPMWDLSYCEGELTDGTGVRVQLPRYQFTKSKLWTEIKDMCKAAGVSHSKLGIWDAISKLSA